MRDWVCDFLKLLLYPTSAKEYVSPVCIPLEQLSVYFNLPQHSGILIRCASTLCDVDPVCLHRAIMNLLSMLQPSVMLFRCASTRCDVDLMCLKPV